MAYVRPRPGKAQRRSVRIEQRRAKIELEPMQRWIAEAISNLTSERLYYLTDGQLCCKRNTVGSYRACVRKSVVNPERS